MAVGSTWAASSQPALTATLVSRTYGVVAGTVADSLVTIGLSNGQLFVLGRQSGLVRGPQWLTLDGSGNAWQQWAPPRPGLGDYAPRTLFALGTGDELGYEQTRYSFGSGFVCTQGYQLRHIVGRQLTADSLVLTYREQTQTTTSAFPGCGTPGTYTTSVQAGRWAISLRTGRSPQFAFLPLLADEYLPQPNTSSLFMGRAVAMQAASSACLASTQTLTFIPLYAIQNQPGHYSVGIDDAAYVYQFSPTLGLGPITLGSGPNYSYSLTYYSRNGVACGLRTNFAGLLPTRAALAAAAATLAPNPAATTTTLLLAAPAQAGTMLALTDALGRRVWSTPVATGQTDWSIPLATQPAGLYFVQLLLPSGPPLTWKLVKTAD
ncbi:T9SS type A sorting domain-containing protein [Hymenobacter sp. BRD67]|uniref:T9SS type A sorting domain-containing protein n=1 Tax=Hymenobacter sp. BRD67 TaxID=2675877 RepID=UPI001564B9F4|nr:T9SS type A sorting domain-containing protein [Hymenobacter sp. BRD67]QKG53251.1 T9SS type A sorting domain-containing protein [Hymenobacter sp. BRD67]